MTAIPQGKAGMAPSTAPLLSVRDLKVQYMTANAAVRAVDGVSFDIAPGEVLGLAGESGSGKSTIAQALLRILNPPAVIASGDITFRGKDILSMSDKDLEQFRWQELSMVFQSAMNALNPVMTVGDQIIDTIVSHKTMNESRARKRAEELFRIVGIDPERLKSYPHELSGGMRQRAVIAIALALQPPMMIMDEPTTALDVVVQKEIMQQIQDLKEEMGFSILFITHDLSLLVEVSDRIAIMYAGQIVELAPAREIYENPLHQYTRGLLNSFPALTGAKERIQGIPGSPPDMAAPPSGCRFHPRCSQVKDFHKRLVPHLYEAQPGHWVACHLYSAPDGPPDGR